MVELDKYCIRSQDPNNSSDTERGPCLVDPSAVESKSVSKEESKEEEEKKKEEERRAKLRLFRSLGKTQLLLL